MQIVDWQQFLENKLDLQGKFTSMTVGIFDGVHLGHQELIKCVISHNADYLPAVVTFRQGKTACKEIQNFEQRMSMFESSGIQLAIVIDFTESFRQMPGINFLELLLKHGSLGFFAVGADFRCGCNLDTNAAAIQNFFASRGITAGIVPEVMIDALPVSSSRIRAAIAADDIPLAEKMLGRAL